jgi:hypothetical protein
MDRPTVSSVLAHTRWTLEDGALAHLTQVRAHPEHGLADKTCGMFQVPTRFEELLRNIV